MVKLYVVVCLLSKKQIRWTIASDWLDSPKLSDRTADTIGAGYLLLVIEHFTTPLSVTDLEIEMQVRKYSF